MPSGYNTAKHGTAESRGYGSAWKKLRASILKRDSYLCQAALAQGRIEAATQVDHIISKATWLKLHGTLAGVDDPSNLQSLSKAAHDAKSLREKGYEPRTGFDASGAPTDPAHHWNR